MDAMDASRFCRILEAASVFDLCDLAQRLIRVGVHLLASDPEGHRVLVLFCNRAYELSRDADLISIYDELTKNRQELGQSLLNELGLESIILVTDYSGNNKHFAGLIQGDLLVRLMMTSVDVKPLITFISSEKVGFGARQPLLATISNNILLLSNHEKGSKNLSGLISVACDEDLHSLFDGFTSNLQDFGQALLNKQGRETIFLVTDKGGKNQQFAGLIQGELLMRFLKNDDDVKPLISFITSEKVGFQARQPLLATISGNIISLSSHFKAYKNLCDLITVSSMEFNFSLVQAIQEHLVAISKLKYGNHVVQSLICLQNEASKLAIASLKGTLMILSKIAYSHFVVQSIFRNSDDMTVLDCFKEINLEELVTNPNGHFVHQSIVRRFETLDIELCRNICSEIVSRKFDFELHDPGYQVFLTCKSVLRKIGN
ncbi:uncharacterized protein LOC125580600 [Brassica napus]|nr:uncharacterized protein LOC125580600 [Brassica napus]XP_048601274.1 uncharacterized protein LOC125580600 [Brassica napus]